jgi:nicotinamide phosphoribosyltransferase
MEDKDHNPIPIFKNPKESSFKKSQRGCCSVYLDQHGEYVYTDGMTYAQRVADKNNALEPIFANGKMIKEYTLAEVRNRLHKGEF